MKNILEYYLSWFFEEEDKTKLSHIPQIINKWGSQLDKLDMLLMNRYNRTLLYHTFFRYINLYSICSIPLLTKNVILHELSKLENFPQKYTDLLLSPFEFSNSIKKELYISLFQLSFTPLCVVTASFNNANVHQKYCDSISAQTYVLYRVLYVDDASTDDTGSQVQNYFPYHNKFTLFTNTENKKQAFSKRQAYLNSDVNEIIVFIDGDDWLAHPNVFHLLNQGYMQYPDVHISSGSFATVFENKLTYSNNCSHDKKNIMCDIIPVKNCRKDKVWKYSHLRTGRSKLFKNIPVHYLQDKDGKWLECCTDVAEMYWALDQCNNYMYIRNIMLHYNKDNSIKYANSYYNESYQERRNEILQHIRSMTFSIPVDSIFIIHLEKRIDRKQKLDPQLNKYITQPYSFFTAIDGADIEFKHIYEKYIEHCEASSEQKFITQGALGLLSTYLSLLHNIMHTQIDSVLLLEDDILFNFDFKTEITKYKTQIEKYDIVYLGANQQNWEKIKIKELGYEVKPGFFKWTYGTFAIILKRKVFEALYLELVSKPIYKQNMPIDCLLNILSEKNNFNIFVCYPNLCIANLTQSDISEARDMEEWSTKLKWNLQLYEPIENENLEIVEYL